jgi:hypothetical protein
MPPIGSMVVGLRDEVILRRRLEETRLELARIAGALNIDTSRPAADSTRPATNIIRNGNKDWSRNNYIYAADTGTPNSNHEAAHIFTHAAPTAGQQLLEDSSDVNADANAATVTALISSAHALYAGNDPAWDETNGFTLLGSTNTLDFPLVHNILEPSKQIILTFVAKLAAGFTWPSTTKAFAGIYDNTAGQRKFLEGSPFDVTATLVGAPGVTHNYEYKVIAFLDWGATIESDVQAVTGPAPGSFVLNTVYVYLTWDGIVGVLSYDVYRRDVTAGVYELIAEIDNGRNEWIDQGGAQHTVGGFPAGLDTHARAYVESLNFVPVDFEWREFRFNIVIPPTYNKGNTTDKQWLRFGLLAALGAGNERKLKLDLFCLSFTDSHFSYCPLDLLAKRGTSTVPTSGDQGSTGTGGGPNPGEGGGRCVCENMPVELLDDEGRTFSKLARDVRAGDIVLTKSGRPGYVRTVTLTEPVEVWRLLTTNGCWVRGSAGHRVIRWFNDSTGRALSRMQAGDRVLTYVGDQFVQSRVWRIEQMRRKRRVVMIQVDEDTHTYLAGRGRGRVVQHNVKMIDL